MNYSTVNFITSDASTNSTTGILQTGNLEMCIFSICFLFGLPLHSYVLWLIMTETKSGVASDFFNLNLSVCEIGNNFNTLFGFLSHFFSHLQIFTFVLQGLGVTGRPLFQCLICVERYLAVVHPVTFLKSKPLRYRAICVTAAWILILGSCLFCMFSFLSLNMVPYVWSFSVQFLLFFSIQMFCLVAVLRALKQSGPGERVRERKQENPLKRKALHIILITTINTVIQYAPFTITGFFVILTQQDILDVWFPAFAFFMLSGFVQPVIYLQRNRTYFCPCSSVAK